MISAVMFCLAGTIPPMVLCGDSFYNLIFKFTSNGSDHFTGSLLLPNFVASFFNLNDKVLRMALSGLIGFALCAVLSYRVRNCEKWSVKFTPWLMVAPIWTYGYDCDASIWLIPITIFLFDVFGSNPVSRKKLAGFVFFICVFWFYSIQHVTQQINAVFILLYFRFNLLETQFHGIHDSIKSFDYLVFYTRCFGLFYIVFISYLVWFWRYTRIHKNPD